MRLKNPLAETQTGRDTLKNTQFLIQTLLSPLSGSGAEGRGGGGRKNTGNVVHLPTNIPHLAALGKGEKITGAEGS